MRLGEKNGRVTVLPAELGACKTKYFLSKCDVVLAARMHCAIGAISSKVPTICISYSMKSKGVLKDIFGDDKWILPLDHLDVQQSLELIQQLLEEKEAVKAHLETVIPEVQKKVKQAATYLKESLVN